MASILRIRSATLSKVSHLGKLRVILEVNEQSSHKFGICVMKTEYTGWGLFAKHNYDAGDVICSLNTANSSASQIVKWQDSFGDCFVRGYTIVPDFAFCCTSE